MKKSDWQHQNNQSIRILTNQSINHYSVITIYLPLFLHLPSHSIHGDLDLLFGKQTVVVGVPHVQGENRLGGEPVVAVGAGFPLALLRKKVKKSRTGFAYERFFESGMGY